MKFNTHFITSIYVIFEFIRFNRESVRRMNRLNVKSHLLQKMYYPIVDLQRINYISIISKYPVSRKCLPGRLNVSYLRCLRKLNAISNH